MGQLIILVVGMALAFIAGVFLCLKSVQLGLKWQIQTKHEEKPTMEKVKNPISEIKEKSNIEKENQQIADVINQYLNGGE